VEALMYKGLAIDKVFFDNIKNIVGNRWSYYDDNIGITISNIPFVRNLSDKNIKDIGKNFDFVVVSEVWELTARKQLDLLRKQGLKIILFPREPFKYDALKYSMFANPRFYVKGQGYFFKPDLVICPGVQYREYWESQGVNAVLAVSPIYDKYYLNSKLKEDRDTLRKKYNI